MTVEANKALIRQHADFMNHHDIEGKISLFAPDYRDNDNPPPGVPTGIEGDRRFFTMLFSAFPDFHVTVDDLVAEKDRVVERLTLRGTHRGMFMGATPTEKPIMWTRINMYRIADGKIVETWSESDHMGLMRQLGLIPPPGGPS